MTYQEAVYTLGTIKWVQVSDSRAAKEREAIAIAIEALEKQIPKKPPNHDRAVCPSCNSKAGYGTPYEWFCCHCGQAIDWGDE